MSEQDSSSRFWRNNANKAPNSRHSSEKLKVKSPLNSLASALGFRPKKSPTLTIEDPPLPIQPPPPSEYAARVVGNRPPSKSVSSTVSRAESSEPKTPSDSNHNAARHSLLTLSDTDPFAPRGIVTIASPSDPTRLSAYSKHSIPEVPQPKTDDRISYASSSSHSHGIPVEFSPPMKARPPISPADSFPSRRLFRKASETNLTRSHSYTPSDTQAHAAPIPPTLHKSPSSATLMSPKRTATRPSMRPRGLTDNGLVQKSGFFVQPSPKLAPHPPPPVQSTPPSSSKPLSPRVIVRQASAQRLNTPPTAPPPRHGLPAPPSQSPRLDNEASPYRLAPSHSTTSSTISFTSSVSSVEILQPLSPVSTPERPRRTSNRSLFSTSATEASKNATPERPAPVLASPPMSLKKALSHQSLRRRVSPSTTAGTNTPESEKTPSKRGFPHPRIPLPPLPSLSLRTSSATASSSADQSANSQDKRVSAASSTGSRRRRLFSGGSSRRPSTSISARADDDAQSVFSVQSDQDMYINPSLFKPWVSTQGSPSHWEEANPDTAPSSPVRSYGSFSQQQIQTTPSVLTLSPFRKGEVSLPRARGMSIRSSDTVFSDHDPEQPIRGAEPTRAFQRSNTLSPRSKGDLSRRTTEVARPSTAQPAYQARAPEPLEDVSLEPAVPDPIEQTFTPSSSPPLVVIRSLPPPPRRTRPARPPEPNSSPAFIPAPPPVKAVATAPPPRPPRRRANKSIEKGIHRRSIMRKPSFLDIDDESEDEIEEVSIPPGSDIGDSFIDFARESFDTVRSDG